MKDLIPMVALVMLAGCDPCGIDTHSAKSGEKSVHFSEVPPGAVLCMPDMAGHDYMEALVYPKKTPAQAEAAFASHMESQGWSKLDLPASVKKEEFDAALRMHCAADKKQLFGKAGSAERVYSTTTECWKEGNITGIHRLDCSQPQGIMQDYCEGAIAKAP
jgi:hypothetical protein